MSPSYKSVPYGLRPAKNIERKMMLEVFARLRRFHALADYQYVGFGSVFFNDFVLFHQRLGIKELICIEREHGDRERFRLNKPFQCIKMKFGESTEILPTLRWRKPTICWLDYDSGIDQAKITDIEQFCSAARSGSFLAVTCDARPFAAGEDESSGNVHRRRLDDLRERVDSHFIPADIKPSDLTRKNTPAICYRIIVNAIREKISERSAGRTPENSVEFRQLLNFRYADGAPMLTVGGVIVDADHGALFSDEMVFADLEFLRTGSGAYELRTPNLTGREIRYLNARLPGSIDKVAWLSDEEKEAYREFYRYFPVFAESEL